MWDYKRYGTNGREQKRIQNVTGIRETGEKDLDFEIVKADKDLSCNLPKEWIEVIELITDLGCNWENPDRTYSEIQRSGMIWKGS